VGSRLAAGRFADAVGVVVPLAAAAGVVTVAALTVVELRLVCSCRTGAEKSVPVTAVRAGLGLRAVLDEGRADRADDELSAAEELLGDAWPESSGAAAATAALAPEAMSKPAPTVNPNVVIRPARLMERTSTPAHSTAIDNYRR